MLLFASVGAAPLAFSNVVMGTREVLGSAPLATKAVFPSRDCSLASAQACWEMNSAESVFGKGMLKEP